MESDIVVVVRHASAFDYLEAANVVVAEYLSRNADSIAFRSRSGLTVTIGGTNMFVDGAYSPLGRATSITITDPYGAVLASIIDFRMRSDTLLAAFEDGTGFPRFFASSDAIAGTDDADRLEGYNGNDTIDGLGGDDIIGGGAGDDVLAPGTGDDRIYGASGMDTAVLIGNQADWALTLSSQGVTATSLLSSETKQLYSIEQVRFDDGSVAVINLAGIVAAADPGAVLRGTAGRDTLIGTDSNEHFEGVSGVDRFEGGAGDDVYGASFDDAIVELAGGGQDHINFSGGGTYTLPDNVESIAAAHNVGVDFRGNALDNALYGGEGADQLDGSVGEDTLHGNNGQDRLLGGDGNDDLYGAAGADSLDAGAGNDRINAGSDDDVVIGGDGDDLIRGDSIGAEGLTTQSDATATRAHLDGAQGPLNILFVSIDDLAPLFSMFPDAPFVAHAPNFEAFLQGSTVFTNAHATVPLCNASRAGVLLGTDADTNGIGTNEDILVGARDLYQSLPSFLQANGYLTAFTGKIFHDNLDRGDPAAWTEYASQSRALDWTPTSFDEPRSTVSQPFAPDVPDRAFADARNLDYIESFLGRAHDSPFFLGLGQFRPHAPQQVPQRYYDLYPLDSIEIPSFDPQDLVDLGQIGLAIARDVNPGILTRDDLLTLSPQTDPTQIKLAIQAYLAAVSYADAVFGEAMAALQASAYANNTAVVLWSDHGFHLAEKFHFSKFTLWEQGTRAPLAISIPGVPGGAVVDSSVSLLDIYKTVADIVGLEPPGHVQGNSLLPLIENPALPWDHPSVTNFNGNYSVRSNAFRYIQYWDGSEELYDHRMDASEMTNLASDPAYADVIADLRRYIPGGDDILSGGVGADVIYGEAGADALNGDEGNDQIDGGTGDDAIDGGAGTDAMAGGAGNDVYTVDDAGDSVAEASDEGIDEVRVSLASFTLGENVEMLTGTSVTGQALAGNGLANRIAGAAGDDIIDGGIGADAMAGGAGSDVYTVDDIGDTVAEGLEEGVDEVRTSLAAYALGENVEALTGTSAVGQQLTGNILANRISGNAGDDAIDGGIGADAMAGGAGSDVYAVDDIGDIIGEGLDEGTDEVRVSLAGYTLGENLEALTGTSATGQSLTGNGLANIVTGAAGDDTIDGGAGADSMAGGAGNDVYVVTEDGDAVTEGADQGLDEVRVSLAAYGLGENVEALTGTSATGQALAGNGLANTIMGAAGDDVIDGGAGADAMAGGAGNDVYVVTEDGDAVTEGADQGVDEVRASLAAYVLGENVELLTGTSPTGQILTGNALANRIAGGTGGDMIDGGIGADAMAGGAGNDIYTVDDVGDIVGEGLDEGTDEVRVSLAGYTLGENVEALTGTSATGQVLSGNAGGNRIAGGAGDDVIDGAAGADTMVGGAGNDVYTVDDATDTIIESLDEGTDEVRVALASFGLGENVELLTGTSATGQNLTGNVLANRIAGGIGHDMIDGGAGADVMAGGAGDDIYTVDDVGDTVAEGVDEGADEVRVSLASHALGDNIEILTGNSVTGQALTGNALANRVAGAAGDDVIDGGAGADAMSGGTGNDIYVVGDAGDSVTEGLGEGTDEVRVSLGGYVLGDNVEILTGISSAGQALTGNALANRITGGIGDDVIEGGAGDDLIDGGGGSDVASYASAAGGVTVDLRTAAPQDTLGAGIDTLIAVENAIGSLFGDRLVGDGASNRFDGGAGNDRLFGMGGDDRLDGGDGNDRLLGGKGADVMVGGVGNDIFYVQGTGAVTIENAGEGYDVVRAYVDHVMADNVEELRLASIARYGTGNALDNRLYGSGGDDVLRGLDGADRLAGYNGDDTLEGGAGDDNLMGLEGADRLDGGDGNDIVTGGSGADSMNGGGGADMFVFREGDAGAGLPAADVVTDFTSGDLIHLRFMDADASTLANDGFAFVGTNAFSGTAGELRYQATGAFLLVEGDTNGDAIADFSIRLDGATQLTAVDFVL